MEFKLVDIYKDPKKLRYLINLLLDFIVDENDLKGECVDYLVKDGDLGLDLFEAAALVEEGLQ